MNKTNKGIIYGSAATMATAGVLHLVMAPIALNFNINAAILFIVSGILQVFWILPTIKLYNKVWYGVGIGGNIVLIALWVITRFNDNPITGRPGPINEMGIAVETLQIAYIVLASIIIGKWDKVKVKQKDTLT